MKCRICENALENEVYEAREMMFGFRDSFQYFQCKTCECLQIATFPQNISKYYPDNYNGFEPPRKKYFQGLKGKFRKKRYEASLFSGPSINRVVDTLFPAKQYHVLGRLGITLDTRIIDVGCGGGGYLYPLYELGMKNVAGIDPFIPTAITYPNGYRVDKKYIYEASGHWDIIMYNHSFEHVPDPLENLLSVKRLLAPQGTCIIRIPTVSSYAWKHYATDWFQLDAPRHFFLHSRHSMELLARQAGLTLTEVIYDSSEMQFIGSEKYRNNLALTDPNPRKNTLFGFLRRKWQKRKYRNAAQKLNRQGRGDQAAFFLKHA